MIKCPECGKEISTDAKTCPGCGCRVKKRLKEQEKLPAGQAGESKGKAGSRKPLILGIPIAVLAVIACIIIFVILSQAERNKKLEPYKTIGSIVTFGDYEQDNNLDNGPEPIEWIVLDVQDGKTLLLSKYGLDAKPYNTKWVDVTWETCSLRAWLNGDFMKAAFTEKEQAAILRTNVDNSESQGCREWDTDGGNNTEDSVFLLSWSEAEQYLETKMCAGDELYPKAQAAPTVYAIRNGAWPDDEYKTTDGDAAGWWWLRSPGVTEVYAAFVRGDGSLISVDANRESYVVRPALWIDLESDIF